MSTGKQPVRAPAVGVFKPDAIRDVAESMGITMLPEGVASALASDVEYRIHQIVQEATRFMRHAKRTTLTTGDIDNALRVLNVEPLYGHHSAVHAPFRRAHVMVPGQAPVYFVEDAEVDFDRALHEEKVFLPKPVSWTAHWLAIEGVQPLVPENPPPAKGVATSTAAPARPTKAGPAAGKKAQAKTVLSRELQLYYTRLTTSLLGASSNDDKRAAALASLRADAGLQALLPFLVRWAGERVQNTLKAAEPDAVQLQVALDVLGAMLANPGLFVEPYLHQMLPPLLSILLTATLPAGGSQLRTQAAQTVARVITAHGTTYPTLGPRITKTLLVALLANGKTAGAREGAVRGLTCLGREAVRMGLFDARGIALCTPDSPSTVAAVLDALRALYPSSKAAAPQTPPLDSADAPFLRERLGEPYASHVLQDAEWATGLAKELRTEADRGALAESGALEGAFAEMERVAATGGGGDEFEMVEVDGMEQIV